MTREKQESHPKMIKISLRNANECLIQLKKLNILNNAWKIAKHGDFLLIPIQKVTQEVLNLQVNLQFDILDEKDGKRFLTQHNSKTRPSLKEALMEKLPFELHHLIPRSYDIIGDIAIIELNREELKEIHPYKTLIGQTILEINPHIQTVIEKSGDVDGVFRTRKFRHVVGLKRTDTFYRENECRFHLDISHVFFTPRLGYERARLATFETKYNHLGICWDMFCGVGPFFIQIAKQHPHMKFLATDINEKAIEYAKENVKINTISNDIDFITVNVSKIEEIEQGSQYHNQISRIIMNLPEKNLEFLDILPPFLHPKGTLLHIYQFNEKPDSLKSAKTQLIDNLQDLPIIIKKIISGRIVKPFSPALDTTVLDTIILPTNK